MRRFLHHFILSLIILQAVSLQSYAQKANRISGTVLNPGRDSISLGEERVKIQTDGKFHFNHPVTKPEYRKLTIGKEELELYLEPGKNLVLTFQEDSLAGSIRFEGKLATVNYYLLEQARTNGAVNAWVNSEWETLFSKPEEAFIATLDSIRSLYLKPLNELLRKDRSLQPWFLMQQRADLSFPFDRWLLLYPEIHRRYTGELVSLSPKAEAHLYKVNLNDPGMMEFDSYRQFARDYLYPIIQQEFVLQTNKKGMDNKWLYAAFRTVPKVISHPQLREFWLHEYMNSHLEDYGSKNLDSLLSAFHKQVKNPGYRSSIQQKYEQQQQARAREISRVYRSIDGHELMAFISMPPDARAGEKRPAIVFVHGGSGNMGMPDWHFGPSPHGFVNISIEYRLRDRQGTLPPDQVEDVKAFFSWLHQHAGEFGVDTARIIGSGNSNGGFLLLNAVVGMQQQGQASASPQHAPDALILQAAGFDATVNNWWDKYLPDPSLAKEYSPTEFVRSGLPPMLVIHGTEDNSVPYKTAEVFVEKMKAAGNPIEFLPLKGSPHHLWAIPYFNRQARQKQAEWLKKLGYLE
jgi:acetyl esterase/lipase